MVAKTLDGEALASQIRTQIRIRIALLAEEGISAGLGTILVGDDGPSANYVAMKHRDCAEVGISSFHRHLRGNVSTAEVIGVVEEFNEDPRVNAFLVQLPLPPQVDEEAVLLAVRPEKDVDGLHPLNLGKLVMSRPGPLPCTPAGILKLLEAYEIGVEGKEVVIVGRGLTVGRPLALLLSSNRSGANAAVSVVHSRVKNMQEITRRADIVISAAGSPGLITPEAVKPGAVVVGAGTSWEGRRLISDIDEGVAEVASFMTPRIGGVGPMTRAMLLENATQAAERDRIRL